MPTECLASKCLVTAVVSRVPHAIYIAFYTLQGFSMLKIKGFFNINKDFALHEVTII